MTPCFHFSLSWNEILTIFTTNSKTCTYNYYIDNRFNGTSPRIGRKIGIKKQVHAVFSIGVKCYVRDNCTISSQRCSLYVEQILFFNDKILAARLWFINLFWNILIESFQNRLRASKNVATRKSAKAKGIH